MKNIILLFITIFLLSVSMAQVPVLTRQLGHTHIVTTTATSNNQQLLASGGIDNTVKLWDAASGKLLYTLKGHSNAVTKCLFSADGTTLFSAGLDKNVMQWNTKTGKLVHTFTGHNSGIAALAISNNGKAIAAGSWDGSIKLWSIQSGEEMISYRKHKDRVNAISFSPNDKMIGSGASDQQIVLWEITKSEVFLTYSSHDHEVTDLCFLPNSTYLASLSNDNKIKIFNYANNDETQIIEHNNTLNSLIVSNDGKTIFCIANKNSIIGWSAENGEQTHFVKTDFLDIKNLSLDVGNNYFLASQQNIMVKLDFKTGQKQTVYEGFSPVVAAVDISPDTRYVVSGNRDNTLRLWQMHNGKEAGILVGHQDNIEAVQFSPDNELLASAGKDKTIKIWQLNNNLPKKAIATFYGHTGSVTSVDFRVDAAYIASGSSDNTVRLWKLETGENVRTFTGHTQRVHSVSISTDGNYIASGSWDKTIKIWDVHNNKLLHTLKGHEGDVWSVDFHPNEKILVSGSADGNICLWNTENATLIKTLKGHTDHVKSVSFAKNGKYIVSGSWDNTIKLWDAQNGNLLKTFVGHENYVRSVAFSPDNKYIISGSSDSQMKIWNIADSKELLSVITFSNGSDHLVTTPDGYFFGSPDGIKNALHYVVDNTVIPLDAFFEKYFTPNLWARVMSGEIFNNNSNKIHLFDLPPLVKIVHPINNYTANSAIINVTVEATDMGGGIDEIRLYHNNKLINTTARGFKPLQKKNEIIKKYFTIQLLPGINELKATAFNNQRTETATHSINISYGGIVPQARLFLFTIGIDQYRNNIYNLNYAAADAFALANSIVKGGKHIYKEIILYELKNENATKKNIEKEFLNIKNKAQENDVFVFFYAGHGVMANKTDTQQQDFFFIPHEITQIYGNDELLLSEAISSDELMMWSKNIKAQKQLLLLDACQSGGAVERIASRGVAEQKALVQLARSAGVTIIASSGTQQYATEVNTLKHGVFTFALLEALNGRADGGNNDKKITINEIRAYLDDRVPELTKEHRGQTQFPTAYSKGHDYPIVICD